MEIRQYRVGFICEDNSTLSQIADSLSRLIAKDTYESHSAGITPSNEVNPNVIRLMKKHFSIDITELPKNLETLPKLDVVIVLNGNHPTYHENWDLDHPTTDEEIIETIKIIYNKIIALKKYIQTIDIFD